MTPADIRRAAFEEAAKIVDNLAFSEECHDCYDDLQRSAPYRRAAKTLRAAAAEVKDETSGRVVYQCPRCCTSMEVDPSAKPSDRPRKDEPPATEAGEIVARLRADCYCEPELQFQCDSCKAADLIERLLREREGR